jgi:hypothetical protein
MTRLNTLLESPGVVINERDLSTTTTNAVGTNVFIPGFTPQGPTDEPISVSSLTEFEEIFGLPSTPAEKYSHNAVKQLLTTSNASITFTRMPYGSGAGYGFSEYYNALIFPIVGLSAVEKNVCDFFKDMPFSTIQSDYPWLADSFVPQSICYGSVNLNCSLASQDEDPGKLYIHNYPFEYNSVVTNFKFVMDGDTVQENLTLYHIRPTVVGTDTVFRIVSSYQLSSIRGTFDEKNRINIIECNSNWRTIP